MPTIDPIDYRRASAAGRRTIRVEVPAELVARKGKTQLARRRCGDAETGLKESVSQRFAESHRRAYRGQVAVHLEIAGIHDLTTSRAHRTIKALIDAMQGPVFADDRAVALLDVRLVPGDLAASISICSASEYADRFDVLRGAREDADDDDDPGWPHGRITPWSWDRDLLDGDELDKAREALADFRSPLYAGGDFADLEDHYARRVEELETRSFTLTPYQATDRPGPLNLAGLIWANTGVRGGANTFDIPAPSGGQGSWTDIATEAWRSYAGQWPRIAQMLRRGSFSLDIAVGAGDSRGFDVDNLAARVLKGMRRGVPDAAAPESYRVFRRVAVPGTVVVTLQHPDRAEALRQAMLGGSLAFMGFGVDRDAQVHRRRADDRRAFQEFAEFGRNLRRAPMASRTPD